MYFSEVTYDGGISEMINRICGTTNAVYANKAKVVDINNALDKYFALGNYQFEDSHQSAAPIETIDLVSGISRYEIDDLTSELLNFLRVEILDSDDQEILLTPNRLSNIGIAYDEHYSDNAVPAEYFKIGRYIDLRPAPNYNKTAGLKIYFNRPASKYTWVAFTADATGDTIDAVAHGLTEAAEDTIIIATDGTIPTGLTADTIVYYVVNENADDFEVALTPGGTKINITDAQTGSNHKFLQVNRSPGIPSIHHPYLARKAALEFLIYKKLPQMPSIAQQIVMDEKDIKMFFSLRNKDERNVMAMAGIAHR